MSLVRLEVECQPRPGTERGGFGSVSSRQTSPPSSTLIPDRSTACPSRTTVYAYDPPDRIHPADRPSKPPPPRRPTHTGLGDEYRKRRTWEPCSVLPMKQEGECRGGRAQKEEEHLCSGSTHTYILYYTIPREDNSTNTPPGGVWSCLASYSIFCLLSGFGWIDLPWKLCFQSLARLSIF